MKEQEICCYLCGTEAKRYYGYSINDSPGVGISVLVVCSRCGEYAITDMAKRYYFFRDDGQDVITDEGRKRLSEYVIGSQQVSSPVIITAKVIRQIIGEE